MWYRMIAVGFVTLSLPAYAALPAPADQANWLDSAMLPAFANSTTPPEEDLIRVADFTRAIKKGVKRLNRLGRRNNAPPAGTAAPISAPQGVAAPSQPLGGVAGQFGAGAPSAPRGPSSGAGNAYGDLNVGPDPRGRPLPPVRNQYGAPSQPPGGGNQPQYNNVGLAQRPAQQGPGGQQAYDAPPQQLGGGQQAYDAPPQQRGGGQQAYDAPPQQRGGGQQAYDAPPQQPGGATQPQYNNAGLVQRPPQQGLAGQPAYDAPGQPLNNFGNAGGRQLGSGALPPPGGRQFNGGAAGGNPQQYDAVNTTLGGRALPPPGGRNTGGAARAQPAQYDAASSAIGSGRPLPPPGSTGRIDPNDPWNINPQGGQ